MTYLPIDQDGHPIPTLRLKENGAHAVNISATAARNLSSFDEDTMVVSIYATVPVYLSFGDDISVTASSADHFFPASTYYDLAIGGGKTGQYKYISVIAANGSDTGTFFISEKN